MKFDICYQEKIPRYETIEADNYHDLALMATKLLREYLKMENEI